jgi:hypothetical protein
VFEFFGSGHLPFVEGLESFAARVFQQQRKFIHKLRPFYLKKFSTFVWAIFLPSVKESMVCNKMEFSSYKELMRIFMILGCSLKLCLPVVEPSG